MEAAGDGTINPLINTDGTPRLVASWPDGLRRLDLQDGAAVLVSNAVRREARQQHERNVRVYEVTVTNATKADAEMANQAWKVTAGGGNWTRWRSRDDAAGTVDEAPRWRVTGPPEIERSESGTIGRVRVILEEV